MFRNFMFGSSSTIGIYLTDGDSTGTVHFVDVSFINLTAGGSVYGLIYVEGEYNVIIENSTFDTRFFRYSIIIL